MRNIWRIFAGDIRLTVGNLIAMLVVVGLCLAPGLYAWINIAGNWDPQAHSGQLKVAVANEDQGYTGEFAPMGANFGDKVVTDLRGNDKYGWVFVGQQEALDGVESGDYYAAIVVPADFSSKLMMMLSANSDSAEVKYYVNAKNNPAASASAAMGDDAASENVRDAFASSVDQAALDAVSDIVAIADSDDMKNAVSQLVGRLDGVAQSLTVTSEQVRAYSSLLNSASKLATSASKSLQGTTDDENAESTDSAISKLSDDIGTAVSDLRDGVTTLQNALPQAADGSEGDFGKTAKELISNAGSFADASESVGSNTRSVSDSLTSTVAALTGSTESLSSDLKTVRKSLKNVASSLDESAKEITDLSKGVADALSTGDISKLAALVGDNSGTLSHLLAAPVKIEREALYPVAPYGSAIAPYYTVLALWAGAVLLVLAMRTGLSEERLRALSNPRSFQIFMGRFPVYAIVALLQATVVWAGDIFFLKIQCEHAFMLLVACWACSFVFTSITYTLAATFGGIGKVLCVALLLVMVVGSGSGYPIEMTNGAFQAAYAFLPFTYGIDAMRECIAGMYSHNYVADLVKLLVFLVPCLIIGLLLRVPAAKAGEFAASKLDRTRVMMR